MNGIYLLRCWLEQMRRVIGSPYERRKWSLSASGNDNIRISTLDDFGCFNECVGPACSFRDKGSRASFCAKENTYVSLRAGGETCSEAVEAHRLRTLCPEVLHLALNIGPPCSNSSDRK